MASEPTRFERPLSYGDDFSVLSNRSSGSRYSQYRVPNGSRMNGRVRPVSRSRDIVQEVYDKMGVNYVRGQPTSFESLIGGNNDQTQQSGTRETQGRPTTPRSIFRNLDPTSSTDENKKTPPTPRPSRGRLTQRWPIMSTEEATETKATSVSVSDMKSLFDRTSTPTPLPTKNSLIEKRDIDDARAVFTQQDEERDTRSVISSSKSVKERITMYRASTGGQRVQLYGINVKKHPSKINIYDSSADAPQKATEGAVEVERDSLVGGMKNDSQSVSRLSVGDAWMSAIHRSTIPSSGNTVSGGTVVKKIPVVEFPHGDGEGDDDCSAASSVSGEDFLSASHKRRARSISDRVNSEYIEKMVEHQIQVQISVLNRKFENEIRRIENRIDRECKARMEALDKRNQELMGLLKQHGVFEM